MASIHHPSRTRHNLQVSIAAGCLAFLLYLRTLAPGVLPSDFAEFQYLPAKLGLPHPNGFPLYMLLGWLWSHIPIGSLAYRMNLLSALLGGLAIGVLSHLIWMLTRRAPVALIAPFFLALSPTFWYYSLGAERYTLTMLLLFAACTFALKWEQSGKVRYALCGATFTGLGMATHPVVVLFIPFWLIYHLWTHPRKFLQPKALGALLLAGGIPLFLYLYVPLRWQALSSLPLIPEIGRSEVVHRGLAFVWYRPDAPLRMMADYILGLRGYAFGFLKGGWLKIGLKGNEFLKLWQSEFPIPLVPVAFVGCLWMLKRLPRLWCALSGFAVLDIAMTLYIEQGKPDAYLLPAFGVFALWLALSANAFIETWDRAGLPFPKGGTVALSLYAILLVELLWVHFPRVDRSHFTDVEAWWREVLSYPLEQGSALLAHWGDLTPLWYFQQAEGIRSDLLGLFPPDEATVQGWLSTGKSLYLAGPLHGWFPQLPQRYQLMPWGKLVRILPLAEEAECPTSLPLYEQPEGWPLNLKGWAVSSPLKGGEEGYITLCWKAQSTLPKNSYIGMRLLSRDGKTLLQKDVPLMVSWYPLEGVKPGQRGMIWIPFRLPTGTVPGEYTIRISIYTLDEGGRWNPWPGAAPFTLGTLMVEPSSGPIRREEPGEVPLIPSAQAGPLRLLAFRASSEPVRPGDPIRLELLWEAINSPQADYKVAFRFWDAGGPGRETEPIHLAPGYPTAWWQEGQLVRGIYHMRAPRGLGNRVLWLEVKLLSPSGPIPWRWNHTPFVGPFLVHDREHRWEIPPGAIGAEAQFGQVARLVGYTLTSHSPTPGDEVLITLYWKALSETDTSYTVFVHLVDESGRLITQHDGIPAGGTISTDLWISGEVIEDPHPLLLPPNLSPGRYTLVVGLYNRDTMTRLPLQGGGDAFPLTSLMVLEKGQ